MREIKFRAWVPEGNRMFWPILLKDFQFGFIHVEDKDGPGVISLDELELMQFTGLKDKNGKEIYEGDIVQYKLLTGDYNSIETRAVVFDRGRFGPLPINEECEDSWYSVSREDYEVIGNIYENPELLK